MATALAGAGSRPVRARRDAQAAAPVGALPEWPVYAVFLGFPAWWALGMSAFFLGMMAVPMLLLLVRRGHICAPRSFLLWLGFLVCLVSAAMMLDNGARFIGYLVRAGSYAGATVLFLYVYNSRMATKRVILALVGYWLFVVFGGWLGVLFPKGSLSTPFEKVLPGGIASNDYVQSLVHPKFAEVQQPYGSAVAFTRPSAPLPFTNGWGCNYALLIPYVLAAFTVLRANWAKLALAGALAVSLIPAFATLNRGLFLAVGIGLAYAAIRLALRGHVKPLFALGVAVAIGLWAAWAVGLYARITQRTTASSTTADRASLYSETLRRTLESPLIGYGAPRPSETLQVSVGTQGHVWNLMFSYGLPALALFVAFLWWTVWRSRRAPDPIGLWLHVCMLMAGVAIAYYGFDGPQLAIVMVTAALLLRRESPPPGGTTGVTPARQLPAPRPARDHAPARTGPLRRPGRRAPAAASANGS